MNEKDWFDCGARIGDLVQSAIDSNNFQQLNKAITDTINQTVDAVQDSLKVDMRRGFREKEFGYVPTHRAGGNAYEDARSRANVGDILDAFAGKSGRNDTRQGSGSSKINRSGKGLFSMIAGFGMAALTGIATLVMMILRFATGFNVFGILMAIFAVLTVVFSVAGAKGGGYRARLKQLEHYLRVMGDRDTITLKELAAGTGKSVREVKKDLKEMISDGMFAGGAYLDEQDTTLMTSHEAYRQYQETMRAYEERKATAEKEKAAQTRYTQGSDTASDTAGLSEETRQILQEGHEFISHIHQCNDAIPGEEMTAKLSRLEDVVTRIFDQVEHDPDSAPDLHRMMSYYLPITRKLVDAYVELGAQDIGGENIRKTRQEIEMSLDTINTAFETFLDSFYQDRAWDISSDISAMKTMMARDGLTGNGDFGRTRNVSRDLGQSPTLAFGEDGSVPAAAAAEGTPAAAESAQPRPAQGAAMGGGAAAAFMEEET